MNFSISSLLSNLIFGIIGFSLVREGRRKTHNKLIAIGILLMAYPYFTSNPWLDWGIGIGLCAWAYFAWVQHFRRIVCRMINGVNAWDALRTYFRELVFSIQKVSVIHTNSIFWVYKKNWTNLIFFLKIQNLRLWRWSWIAKHYNCVKSRFWYGW